MNRGLIAALAAFLVSGCGSMQMAQSRDETVDYQYMARVEQAAKQYGTQVVWVNPPQKRATATQ